ncbi:hypothetical protein DN069_31450 [Streptacidiphilus pinicola]|uniref:Uncharacterized protein n=1 Tax=Streptacidiphilus pinicola TaxID=2219663 RepID=A0A2X0J2R0_9ACTN|nr:hypothetical protein [Streptacidiphilus pinicola]RAG81688.1 hypothetical protein DN069_31450 [Streptacidiphilus pinicola]
MGDAVIGGPDTVPLRPKRLTVPTWRRLLGLAITLAAFAAVILVGQVVGWLTAAQTSAHAAQAADGQARLLVMALRQLTPDGAPAEARFAQVSSGLSAVLVGDRSLGAAEARFTVQITGHATTGSFGGHQSVDVERCYVVDWRPPHVSDPAPVRCPALPAVADGMESATQLAQDLNTAGGIGSGRYLAAGVLGACAFGEQSRNGFLSWPAPALTPCDGANAAKAALFRD